MKHCVAAAILLLCLAGLNLGCGETKNTSNGPEAGLTPGSAFTSTASPVLGSPTKAVTDLLAVAAVVDGDTIKVMIKGKTETIRIIGLNTPETVDQRRVVECFGREASAKAHELLDGQKVSLVADPSQGDRDQYDRLLRYVDRADGLDFALYMIKNGFAHEFTYNLPYQRQTAYKAAYAEARKNQAGFWSPATCNGNTEQPADATTPIAATATRPGPVLTATAPAAGPTGAYPCQAGQIKGNRNSMFYHAPGQQDYANTKANVQCFNTEQEAVAAGYRRAPR